MINFEKAKYTVFPISMGWTGLVGTPEGLYASILPRPSREEAERALLSKISFTPEYSPDSFEEVQQQLQAHYEGQCKTFNCKIDWSWASPFQKDILQLVSSIPAGTVISYGEAALLAGKPGAARAVGRALSANKIPVIIPCHRVIRRGGQLGGFTGAGLDVKSRLLELEGVIISS